MTTKTEETVVCANCLQAAVNELDNQRKKTPESFSMLAHVEFVDETQCTRCKEQGGVFKLS